MNKNIETLTKFLSEQMDGAQVPPTDSAAFNKVQFAVTEIVRAGSANELREFAVNVMDILIARVRSNIEAEIALQAFIRPGRHD